MNLANAFFDQARAHPDQRALILAERSLSYAELAGYARALARELVEQPAAHVALLAARSPTAYAGALACLGTGAAYVPLNPSFPVARNLAMLERVRAGTLIADAGSAPMLRELLPRLSSPVRVLTFDDLGTLPPHADGAPVESLRLDSERGRALGFTPQPLPGETPAYVLFTSGSTGAPKGVVVSHHNVLRYVRNFLELYPITTADRVTQTFDLTFDLSVHDQFVCWAAGATLVVYPPSELASPLAFTREHGVSVWFSVPSAVAHLESARRLDAIGLPGLRLSLFCGEKLTFNAWQLWRRVAPNSRIVNLYGPTETTIAITHFEVPSQFPASDAAQGVIPIGTPLPGQTAEVRRENGELAAAEEVGALWLAGDQLALGYFEAPELTAERFVHVDGERRYRTGDRASRDRAGRLQFFGRDDLQVKLMGYRVELTEVEHALRAASGSAEAVALVIERDGLEELCAVLPEPVAPRKTELRRALEKTLPHYMRPRRYCFVATFPLNANGKIDRGALARSL